MQYSEAWGDAFSCSGLSENQLNWDEAQDDFSWRKSWKEKCKQLIICLIARGLDHWRPFVTTNHKLSPWSSMNSYTLFPVKDSLFFLRGQEGRRAWKHLSRTFRITLKSAVNVFLTTFWVFHSWWWFLRSSSHLWMKAKNKVGNCNTPCLTSRKSRLLAAVVWQQSLSVSAEQLVETVSLAIGVRVADYGGRQKCSWCVYALFLVSDQCHTVIWFKVNAFWAFFFGGGGLSLWTVPITLNIWKDTDGQTQQKGVRPVLLPD